MKQATVVVLQFFSRLREEFGALFDYKEHRYEAHKAKEWAIHLLEEGITKEEFEVGVRKSLREQEYPVERSYTFIKLCRDYSNDFLNVREAYIKASNLSYPHEVVYETAKRVGFWELRTQPEGVSYKAWQQHYSKVCAEYAKGVRFSLPEEKGLEYKHTPMKQGTEFAKKVDDFLNQYRRGRK